MTPKTASEINSKADIVKLYKKGALYVVATPIGNLGDFSKRASETLAKADRILCEDTRVSRKLCALLSLKAPLHAYHDHNGEAMRPKILAWLEAGEKLALISDAGTPLISDPGYKLVDSVQEAGYAVYAVPGPSAVIAGLSIAGLPSNRFLFMGFAPQKKAARQAWFDEVAKLDASLAFYESPHRLIASLEDAAISLGDRPAAVCRELTKIHEEVVRGNLNDLSKIFKSREHIKGEIVIIIAPPAPILKNTVISEEIERLARLLLPKLGVKASAALLADYTSQDRKSLYSYLQKLKDTA